MRTYIRIKARTYVHMYFHTDKTLPCIHEGYIHTQVIPETSNVQPYLCVDVLMNEHRR